MTRIKQTERRRGAAKLVSARYSGFFYGRGEAYREQYPQITGCAPHDPLAVVVTPAPGLVTVESMQVDVECAASFRAVR
ncbi:nucleoside hydrolase [Neorhizobium galegae]|uniref:nucleoside hydrolase n=1 Tax=Neorhizobium galegae TaxID=399 RepID=UPI0006213D86|nr:nucleoside hydrolase [Neorhizobium galegae]KAA9383481.1 nucleoside hydrolase [Neorhizobium galegae]MCM2500164.1 nucleoside hydrolase [Neorhizobium galegae]MCQ1769696.1 nucleoside hydrolase [Neorhizobium galegae]CDZ26508.1 Hypothetical protein NGAL_HAMBI490_13470 [Neorhizobium galegae bv. officinalis]